MKWIKASEGLPKKLKGIIFRQISSKIVLSFSMAKDWIEDKILHDLEWLDESAPLSDGQDELWAILLNNVDSQHYKYAGRKEFIEKLKSKYTLIKKQ